MKTSKKRLSGRFDKQSSGVVFSSNDFLVLLRHEFLLEAAVDDNQQDNNHCAKRHNHTITPNVINMLIDDTDDLVPGSIQKAGKSHCDAHGVADITLVDIYSNAHQCREHDGNGVTGTRNDPDTGIVDQEADDVAGKDEGEGNKQGAEVAHFVDDEATEESGECVQTKIERQPSGTETIRIDAILVVEVEHAPGGGSQLNDVEEGEEEGEQPDVLALQSITDGVLALLTVLDAGVVQRDEHDVDEDGDSKDGESHVRTLIGARSDTNHPRGEEGAKGASEAVEEVDEVHDDAAVLASNEGARAVAANIEIGIGKGNEEDHCADEVEVVEVDHANAGEDDDADANRKDPADTDFTKK